MNITRIREVQQKALENPESFDMGIFFFSGKYGYSKFLELSFSEISWAIKSHSCGTAACLGGWAVALYPQECVFSSYFDLQLQSSTHDVAKKILNLSNEQANRLFYVEHWLGDYGDRYIRANDNDAERAKIAYEYIDYFVICNGEPDPEEILD